MDLVRVIKFFYNRARESSKKTNKSMEIKETQTRPKEVSNHIIQPGHILRGNAVPPNKMNFIKKA